MNSFKLLLVACVGAAALMAGEHSPGTPAGVIWQDRGDVAALDLTNGPGGKEHQPSGTFKFLSEDMGGTSPKFDVEDEQGVRWRVKLGEEVRSETAATRLVWAAGYFADEDYFLPEIHVTGMTKLKRGESFVSPGGVVRDVRMERKLKGQKKIGNWNWFNNPFAGTRELNGLRVMMAMINNWDLKTINNSIYQEKGAPPRYVVTDLGASFGKTGNSLTRSKAKFEDYQKTKFVQEAKHDEVSFYLSSRPFFISTVNFPNYYTRTHMEAVVKKIPVADAKWLGTILGKLSPQQIQDCFKAAGFSPEEVDGYSKIIEERIAELNQL